MEMIEKFEIKGDKLFIETDIKENGELWLEFEDGSHWQTIFVVGQKEYYLPPLKKVKLVWYE